MTRHHPASPGYAEHLAFQGRCFDPLTASALVLAGASTAMSVSGQIAAGKAQQAQANYNAAVAERDAVAQRQAAAAQEQIIRARAARMLSKQRALYAKAGVTMEGTPLAVLADQAQQAELDALTARYEGEIGAQRSQSQAAGLRASGTNALRAGYMVCVRRGPRC